MDVSPYWPNILRKPPQTSKIPARMMNRLLHPQLGQTPYGPRGP
jgi:hypothetical protein